MSDQTTLDKNAKLVALIVGGAFFIQQLDATVITTALPAMARSLNTNPVRLSVGITGYVLAQSIFVPVSGWVSDRLGAKRVFRAAMVVFALGSLLCAISRNVPELAASRIFQGLGGAMMAPVGRLLLFRSARKAELVRLTTYLTLPQLFAPVIGPLVGGFITDNWSWPWIFLINIPFVAVGLVLAGLYIPEYKEANPDPLDWTSFLLSGAGLSTAMIGMEELSHGETSIGFALVAVGLVLGIACVRHARRHPSPVLDMRLFSVRTFAANFWGGGAFRLGMGGLPYLYPLLFQTVFGLSASASGFLTVANAVGGGVVRPALSFILKRLGFRTTLIAIGALASFLIFLSSRLTVDTPHLVIFALLVFVGLSSAIQYTSMQTIAISDVPQSQMSAATTLLTTTNQFNRGLGVAIAALLLHVSMSLRGGTSLAAVDFHWVLAIGALMTLLSLVDFLRLDRNAGAEVSGHHSRRGARAEPKAEAEETAPSE